MKKIILAVILIIGSIIPTTVYAKEIDNNMPVFLGEFEVDSINEYQYNSKARIAVPDWLNNGNRFFYDYLANEENGTQLQEMYAQMYEVLYNFTYDSNAKLTEYNSSQYLCTDITKYESVNKDNIIFDVYNALLQDNPQFFYVDVKVCIFKYGNRKLYGMQIMNEYCDYSARVAQTDMITARISEYDAIIDNSMSNYAIEKAVHDKLIIDNDYATDENGNPKTERYAHTIIGCLDETYGGGVCESYAKSTQLLLTRYGVNCYSAMGLAQSYAHMWNFVQLDDGNYYCYDATWDDPVSLLGKKYLKYDYFNKPYTDFYKNRNNQYTYYEEALPQGSDNTTYYTQQPNTASGEIIDGNIVYVAPNVEETESGDINKDGNITSTDATLVLMSSSGLYTLSDAQFKLADINKDGNITPVDATMILIKSSR